MAVDPAVVVEEVAVAVGAAVPVARAVPAVVFAPVLDLPLAVPQRLFDLREGPQARGFRA